MGAPIVGTAPDARDGFISVPRTLLSRTDLSQGARMTYIALLSYGWQDQRCWPGVGRLATDVDVSERQVRVYLNELQQAEALSVVARPGRTNVYELHLPPRKHSSAHPGSTVPPTPEAQFRPPRKHSSGTPEAQFRPPRKHSSAEVETGKKTQEEDSTRQDKRSRGSRVADASRGFGETDQGLRDGEPHARVSIAPVPRLVTSPSHWRGRLAAEANQIGVLLEAIEALWGVPRRRLNAGRLGRLAGKYDPKTVFAAIWDAQDIEIKGDPLSYLAGVVRRQRAEEDVDEHVRGDANAWHDWAMANL